MTLEEAQAITQFQMGTLIVLMHVFNCLNDRGVLPLVDAISSLEETEQGLPPDAAEATRWVIRGVARGLREQPNPPGTPDPAKPPSPTRPNLRLIQGGQSE